MYICMHVIIIIIIIKSRRASRRIRPPRSLTGTDFLSSATALATCQLLHPALFRFFSTVLLQVVFVFLSPSDLQESITLQCY